ncbi:ankyrin repeat domain-containing protein [Mesorhizobium sp. LHD-90]|nr:ankyrin repeat domain-containing protein [Mesorhizobium sp. LHD-90]MDQ6434908.1 ankyrin repeat domain-containing protein [Mesorhizobium sp. LHD-90]
MILTRVVTMVVVALVSVASLAPAEGGEESLLYEAAAAGDVGQVKRLLAAGAEVDMRDSAGRTPLLLATHANHVEVARLLIQAGADVNARDAIHDTPFLYAGAEGCNEILRHILATGKANLKDTNRYGGVALIPAAHHGHPETVRILLETDIDVDHVNRLGWTALMETVILGDGGPIYQEIAGLLLGAGARQIPDRDGVTPLQHARSKGYERIAAMIESSARDG